MIARRSSRGRSARCTRTVVEAIVSASLCVLLVLLHVRTSLVIASTIPLAALSSFLIMSILRRLGIVDIQANAMSLAGIAISIGVLVDSSVVMAENVMHRLREQFGGRVVRGDVRDVVLRGVPGGGKADRFLGGDHGAFVPARLCAGRASRGRCFTRWPTPRRSRWGQWRSWRSRWCRPCARSSFAGNCARSVITR